MPTPINDFFRFVFDLVAPARPTEQVVRELTLDSLIALASPDGTLPYHKLGVRALVWELKYRANAHAATLAGEYISDLILAEAMDTIGKPLLIPMPMHEARRRERGYNQTELLCEAALKHLGDSFEYRPDVLERTRNTPPQQGLERHKRLKNVKGSMQIKNPATIKDRVCVVVDDVSTTGASFVEAKRTLLASGAAEVKCVPLAHS